MICFDESPVQLIGEVRQPIPAAPGQLERYDYEYRRNGTVNLFVVLDVHRPWRKVRLTEAAPRLEIVLGQASAHGLAQLIITGAFPARIYPCYQYVADSNC